MWSLKIEKGPLKIRGVVVNFDLGERFSRPRSQQRGCGRPLPLRGSGGVTPENFFEIFDAKSRVWGQFRPEYKLTEGQPNEYDVICRNASVLAFHLWTTIFAGAPFRLQNIYRNGVPPRSRTTTPLLKKIVVALFWFWASIVIVRTIYTEALRFAEVVTIQLIPESIE